jgi:acetoin utilization deacetylase AcuC-like enzyme
MATLLFSDPLCHEHDAGPEHVESARRLAVIEAALRELPAGVRAVTTNRAATEEELGAAHDAEYVHKVLALRGQRASLDHETHLGPRSVDAARHAAGACLSLAEALLDGSARRGVALVRPPGHHASARAGSGFCIFNNIAIAACAALKKGLSRVLIVDWDVHHGNGTQAIFYDRREVFFFDVHQDGLYPETGAAHEIGAGAGRGYTKNLPLMPLMADDEFLREVQQSLVPAADYFRPQLVLVSCGFDAHAEDPEGGMALSADGFARLTTLVRGLADHHCAGRLGLILEGGYALSALPECARATLLALSQDSFCTQEP